MREILRHGLILFILFYIFLFSPHFFYIPLSCLPTPMLPKIFLLALATLMMAKESELFAAAFSPSNALLRGCCGQNF